MNIVEFSDTDKQNCSTSSSSSNSDSEDSEAVLLPVSIEETVKTATIENVESVPLDEDTNDVLSKTPFCTDPLVTKEYTIIPDEKNTSSGEDDYTVSEIKLTELGIPLEDVIKYVPTENEKRFTVGEEPEDIKEEVERPLGELVSVKSSTTDPLNVIEYSTIPQKKHSLSSSSDSQSDGEESLPFHFTTEEMVSPVTMESVESIPVFEDKTDVGDAYDSPKVEVVPVLSSTTEPVSVLQPFSMYHRKSSTSSSSNDDEPVIIEEKEIQYDFEVIPSKDSSASEDESADSELEEVSTPRTVTSVNFIDMTTDPVTVSIDLPKKLVEDALNEDTTETFHITQLQSDPMNLSLIHI